MKTAFAIVAVLCSPVLAPSAHAADLGAGFRVGTYGLSAEFGIGVTPWFGLRAGASAAEVSDNYEQDDIDYDGTLTLGGYGLMADFFPMKGTFRFTVGVLSNRNAIDLEAVPTAPVEIGDSTYTPSEVGTLQGDVEFDTNVPYFGIGWGNFSGKGRVGFICDIGVVAQGAGEVTLTSTAGLVDPDDLADEVATIEEDIEDYELWPVLSAGILIRF